MPTEEEFEKQQQENEELKHGKFHSEQMEKERKISDDKYAAKWVQDVMYNGLKVVLGIILTALMYLVVKGK